MVERPRLFLLTKSTNSTTYQPLLVTSISINAKGISYLTMSIDPDPNALYVILVAKVLREAELEITAVWTVEFPHLTSGVYQGFEAGDYIAVFHRTTDAAITVKSGISLAFNEVIA